MRKAYIESIIFNNHFICYKVKYYEDGILTDYENFDKLKDAEEAKDQWESR